MLKLAMIAPTCLIDTASKYSDCAMWLTHLLDDNSYVTAIKSRSYKQPSLLDNSFFELGKAIPLETMKLKAKQLGEEVTYILPDGEFHEFESVASSMLIPTSLEELWVGLRMCLQFSKPFKIGISCIHARKSLGQESFDADTRIRFVETALAEFSQEEQTRFRTSEVFHFLGLDNMPWEELKLLKHRYNASLDSSAFVWPCAKTHGSIKIWETKDKYRVPVDFCAPLSIYTKELCRQRLEETKKRFLEI